jgi:hypothetical protein
MNDLGIQASDRAAKSSYLVFQYRGLDVLAVPDKSKDVCLAGLKKFHAYTARRKVYRTLLSCLIRCGVARMVALNRAVPVEKHFGVDFKAWQAHLESSLGRPIPHIVAVWPAEAWRRRLYVHLLDADLQAFGFVKLTFRSNDRANLRAEAQALEYLSLRPLPTVRVPKLLDHGTFGDVNYLIMNPLPKHVEPLGLTPDWNISTLTAEYSGPSNPLRGTEILQSSWWPNYAANLLQEHQGFHQELMRLLPLGTEVCRVHGDLGLGNMLRDGDCTWIFDWECYHSGAPVLVDKVGFFMSFTVARMPRHPKTYLDRFNDHFSTHKSEQRRLAVMLAIAYRHACAVPDAARLMKIWGQDAS